MSWIRWSVGIVLFLLSPSMSSAEGKSVNVGKCIEPWPVGSEPPLFSGLGKRTKPIIVQGTKGPLAQAYFDQGLTLLWAFNHPEAIHSFNKAAELDPEASMPLWGIAMAAGPDINTGATDGCLLLARTAIQEALVKARSRLSNKLTNDDSAERELAYVEALHTRYILDRDGNPQVAPKEYGKAMKQLMSRYPDDMDAATLFAASQMNIDPWKWWIDGKPTPEASQAIETLKNVLERDATHLGAHHYFIHSVEESPHPEQAMESADRIAELAPAAGHIVHMPSHIFRRTGDHARASAINYAAVSVDRLYVRQTHATARYPLHYLGHNLHFLAVSLAIEGRETESLAVAQELFENTLLFADKGYNRLHNQTLADVKNDYFFAVPILIAARFRNWNNELILKIEEQLGEELADRELPFTRPIWAYADLLRYLGQDKSDPEEILNRLERFWFLVDVAPADLTYGNNKAVDLLRLANTVLLARAISSLPAKVSNEFVQTVTNRLASSARLGQLARILASSNDQELSVALWRHAVAIQDSLSYNEPPDWYYSVRESLGAALYKHGKFSEAEAIFRQDLERHRGNGRSLFGLIESLRAQNKKVPEELESQFQRAWKNATIQLAIDQF